ncbi:MAG: glycosyltransferase [Saccharospirillum sp.]|nr:glycosyltransferase [Saccharospirillum sp.]
MKVELDRMNILYLAYAFPPVNIVASHRALFQAVYMAKAGATVTVVCAEQSSKRDDPELLQYLQGVPGLTVHYIQPWGVKGSSKAGKFKPSAKSWLWVLRVAKLVSRLMRTQRFDVVYSTYGPKYPHLAGRLIHGLHRIPWVVEYRDPWHGGRKSKNGNTGFGVAFERWLLKPVELIIAVSKGFSEILESIHGKTRKYEIVYNGYESTAVSRANTTESTSLAVNPDAFKVILLGTLYPFQLPSLEVLLKAMQRVPGVTFHYFGSSTDNVKRLIDQYNMSSNAVVHGLVPHEVVIKEVKSANVAFLPASTAFKGILPVKFYDYLGTRTPVLMVGGDKAELESIVNETDSGVNIDASDDVAEWLRQMINGEIQYSFKGSEFYTRKNQAEQLLQHLKTYVSKP